MILTFWGLMGFVGYTLLTNPEFIGEFFGKIVQGFEGV